jgi:hypothetical protein
MHDVGAVLIILAFIIGAAVVTWVWWHFIGRGMEARQARRERLTLVLNPLYRAKVEEDRRYQLAWANIALQRERLYKSSSQVQEVTPAQIAAPALPVPTFADLLEEGAIGRGVRLLLGYREGAPRYGTWLDLYSCAIAGLQGSGKTTTELFIILQSVLAGALLLIVDPHRDTAQDSLGGRLAPLAACFMRPIAGDDDRAILAIIKTVRKEVERRRRGGTGSPVILVIDEFTKLMRRSPAIRDELAACIEEIAQEGRKMHVFALLSGQIWKAGASGGTELRYSLASSFVHRIQEQQSKLLIPGEYAKLSPRLKPGEVLFYDTGGDTALMQIPLTTEQDVATVASMIASPGADFTAASPRLPDTPGEVRAISPLKLLTKPHEATNELSGALLSPELESKYRDVVTLMAQEKKQGYIISAVWGVTSGGGAAYQKAAEELRTIQRMIAEHALSSKEA